MNDWLFYALISLAQLSFLMALYKVPAAKQIDKYGLSAWSYFFATLFAGALLYRSIYVDPETILIAFLWGTGYSILTLVQMHVLHTQDTSSVFPFTTLVSNILVVIGGVLFLNEYISLLQWVAISLAILLFVASYWNSRMQFVVQVLPSFMFISLISTINKFVQKAGADHVSTLNFIFWQLTFAFLVSLVILFYVRKKIPFEQISHRPMLAWAFVSGIFQFGASYTIVTALSLGPISLIYIILGLYTFFTSLLANLFFKEKITVKSILFIFLSFLIVLLIKFG